MNKKLTFLTALLLLFTLVFPAVISGCTGADNLSEQVLANTGLASAAEPSQLSKESQQPASAASSKPFSAIPKPAVSAAPSASPKSAVSAAPSAGPKPAESPAPSESAKPFPRPSAIPTPTPVPSPQPTPTPTPTPAPTAPAFQSYRLEVDVTNQVVSAYAQDGKGKYSILVRQMICSSGKPSTPTPLGTYTLPGTKYDRGTWGYFSKFHVWARYFVRIKGGYLFHSVIYAKNDVKTLKQSTVNALGTPVSAGCIRLRVEDAKWIYDNAKPGTTVDIVKKEKNTELTASVKSRKPGELPQPPEAVSVSLTLDKKEKLEIKVGETAQMKAMVTYNDKTEKDETANAEWTLDKEGIAAVNKNTIQGIAPGLTVLTVKFKGVTASIEVLVTDAVPPESPGTSAEFPGTPAEESPSAPDGSPDASAGSADVPDESSSTPAESTPEPSGNPFPRPPQT